MSVPRRPPSPPGPAELPTVSIVFLVYNRREELRTSLREMLERADYPRERLDVVVVDNASEDGAAEMVRAEFPDVRLVEREVNCGVSGWNDGIPLARGEWVLLLDDDCYLPGDGLRRALEAAATERADLVSFGVTRHGDPGFRFDRSYRTGLLTFWGCAVLVRGEALAVLGGYDPEIFVWANELELMIRFFDHGYRHLHAPEILAVHIKGEPEDWRLYVPSRAYRINSRHFAYVAAKLLAPRDAAEALVALAAHNVRDAVRLHRDGLRALPETLRGFAHGLRHRDPVANRAVSRAYRMNFRNFASPWWLSRSPRDMVRAAPGALVRRALGRPAPPPHPGRREAYYEQRARYYPTSSATLRM